MHGEKWSIEENPDFTHELNYDIYSAPQLHLEAIAQTQELGRMVLDMRYKQQIEEILHLDIGTLTSFQNPDICHRPYRHTLGQLRHQHLTPSPQSRLHVPASIKRRHLQLDSRSIYLRL